MTSIWAKWKPSIADIVAITVAALLACVTSTALTQSDGDLFAHVAFGRAILAQWSIPDVSVIGFAPVAVTLVAPAWGGAVILALLERAGGLAMVAAFTAALAGATHGTLAWFLKTKKVEPAFVCFASLLGVVLVSSHWLARPHAFSLAASALLVILLERGTRRALLAIPALFVLWVNLHGGWIFGLIVLVCYTVGAFAESWLDGRSGFRRPWKPLAAVFSLSMLATLANPYGLALHATVIDTLMDPSVSTVIDEFQPPSIRDPSDLVFFALLVLSVVLMVRGRRRPPLHWMLVMLVTAIFALRAGRNISLFGVTAWPLIAMQLAPDASHWLQRFAFRDPLNAYDARVPAGRWSAAALALLLLVGATGGRIGDMTVVDGTVDPRRFPVDAVRRLRDAGLGGPLLTTWTWSGYVPYEWPGRRTYFDPLAFSSRTLTSFGTMLLARPGWRIALDTHAIDWVMVPSSVPLGDSLRVDTSWSVWHEDATVLVLHRRVAPAAVAR